MISIVAFVYLHSKVPMSSSSLNTNKGLPSTLTAVPVPLTNMTRSPSLRSVGMTMFFFACSTRSCQDHRAQTSWGVIIGYDESRCCGFMIWVGFNYHTIRCCCIIHSSPFSSMPCSYHVKNLSPSNIFNPIMSPHLNSASYSTQASALCPPRSWSSR